MAGGRHTSSAHPDAFFPWARRAAYPRAFGDEPHALRQPSIGGIRLWEWRRSELARNQRAALKRYASAAVWSIVVDVSSDAKRARELAASRAIDIVLTWQLHDSPDEIDVVTTCRTMNIDFLALAQSCAALAE